FAGGGVAFDFGHDNRATGNRIVSCGEDSSHTWYAMPWSGAVHIWDYYQTGSTSFYNNTVTSSLGGVVQPNSQNLPRISDIWAPAPSILYPGNSVAGNDFNDPCFANGQLNPAAEDAERSFRAEKLVNANELVGDQHELFVSQRVNSEVPGQFAGRN